MRPVQNRSKLLYFKLPWWCKIVAYVISWLFMITAIVVILVKGLEFGDEKVSNWIASMCISIATSIFLTQPLQVVLVSLFLVLLCRGQIDNMDVDEDGEDRTVPLNNDENYLQIRSTTALRTVFGQNQKSFLQATVAIRLSCILLQQYSI